VEALGLTKYQGDPSRAVEEEIRFGQLREMQSGKAPEGADKGSGLQATDRILAILKPDQLLRWREMAGEPVRGPLNAFPTWFGTRRDPRRTTR